MNGLGAIFMYRRSLTGFLFLEDFQKGFNNQQKKSGICPVKWRPSECPSIPGNHNKIPSVKSHHSPGENLLERGVPSDNAPFQSRRHVIRDIHVLIDSYALKIQERQRKDLHLKSGPGGNIIYRKISNRFSIFRILPDPDQSKKEIWNLS